MITIEEFMKSSQGKALIELNDELKDKNFPHFTLNVIGGFALMLRGKRNIECNTDVDYIGENLSSEITGLIDRIGRKYNLMTGWINNEVMLSGISQEDFELSTGKLNFEPYMELESFSVNVLDDKGLLKMKLIAIDTSLMALESGADFTRMKDIPDILILMKDLDYSYNDIKTEFGEYINTDNTIDFIMTYEKEGKDKAWQMVSEITAKNPLEIYIIREERSKTGKTPELSFVRSVVDEAFRLAKERSLKDKQEDTNVHVLYNDKEEKAIDNSEVDMENNNDDRDDI